MGLLRGLPLQAVAGAQARHQATVEAAHRVIPRCQTRSAVSSANSPRRTIW
jgi:hypothetical protein